MFAQEKTKKKLQDKEMKRTRLTRSTTSCPTRPTVAAHPNNCCTLLLILLSFLFLHCSSLIQINQVSPVFINQHQQPTTTFRQLQQQQFQEDDPFSNRHQPQQHSIIYHQSNEDPYQRATTSEQVIHTSPINSPIKHHQANQLYKNQLHPLTSLLPSIRGNGSSSSGSALLSSLQDRHSYLVSAAAAKQHWKWENPNVAMLPKVSTLPPINQRGHHESLQRTTAGGATQQTPPATASKQPVGLLDKICIGTSNRLSAQHNKSDHYQNLVERYKNCTYVIGNLELTWLDRSSGSSDPTSSSTSQIDLSFLESIREITGYLLIAYVDVDKIRMPNLQIIRGRDLFKLNTDNDKEEFALIMIENELRQLELPNLREILAGSVGSYNNRNLCHIRTINWDEILNWPMYRSVFVYNGTEPECPPCDQSCQGGCWGTASETGGGAEMCQKFSKVGCSAHCGNAGRCYGHTQAECCHSFCAGGCTGPNQTQCLACKNFYDDGACVQECPAISQYNPSKFLWEANPNGKYAFGATCVKECPEHMLRDSGACVRVCPPDKRIVNGECVSCGGPCPKNCQGVELVHSGNIDQWINCTVIEGSITILDESFTGFSELNSNQRQVAVTANAADSNGAALNATATSLINNSNISQSIVRHKPMHPSRLEVFKTLREITGYLKIEARHENFKNLSYFANLMTIHGHQTTDTFHALSIKRSSLVSLNLRSLRKIRSGKITIEDNPELCFAETIDWHQLNITRYDEVTIRNNAESSKCGQLNLTCHHQCAKDGCWGPGPDECLSCNNYKLDDYCVVNCSATESLGFLSYEDTASSRMCKRCDSECRLGCTGVEARDCLECKNVKDGPYCVPECPSHKYNNNGTCEECDKSCADGCTGPSNRLGEGGCNTCAKAIIKSSASPSAATELTPISSYDVTCIRLEEPCPDGYYQEYAVHSMLPDYSPLRSATGRPVCRKCHHRCKRCIGMGTHKTVCECAKYVNGEQCEDFCPRDHFADEESRQCVKCSPECLGCSGPTEADCIRCRVYRIYYEASATNQSSSGYGASPPMSSASIAAEAQALDTTTGKGQQQQQVRFNCTAMCPADKPHLISQSNLLDPYCSEDPGIDIESPIILSLGSSSILCLLIILTALMFCISIYRCQIEKDKTVKLTMHLSGMDDVEPLDPSNYKPNLSPLRSIKETELRKGKVLGSGFGGTVYQGFWSPEGQEDKVRRPVAIKVLRDNGQSNMNKEFLDEAYIMASVNHPNLVRLLAVCMTPNHLMLVTRLMPLGCLLDYVKKNRGEISSKNLLEWGKQIARGMAYLEEQRMVHRDLALRNVLLQTSGRACISDFGLAKLLEVDQSEYQSGGGRLPIKWLAPECFREKKFTHKSDVWAFGVTIWELVTFGQRPFEEYKTQEVPMAIETGARLQQPNYVTAEVYKVMIACWFYNPDDRPNFKSLVKDFAKFARDPERFLIVGAKGIELTSGGKNRQETIELDGSESGGDDPNDGFSSALDSDDDGDTTTQQSPTSSSQPPLSAMPDLTPSTHNRMNEMFRFELRHHHHHQHHHHRLSESEATSNGGALPTPILKKLLNSHGGSERIQEFEEEVFGSSGGGKTSNGQNNVGRFAPMKTSNMMIADANNNNLITNNNSCWSMHHTISTNSLGQRSEQPTDMYDYLLPSPHTDVNRHAFNSFCTTTYDDRTLPISVRQPPHSAGLVSNVTNEEYFLTRTNYVNQKLESEASQHLHHHRLSTSNGNIPQSLV